ncbi:hypothetical protein SAMN05518871_11348 [Psychrobacillus sp. OK028]|uniref:hypothetical protein n=1 Tax=Psychrobacillus sp. OK028 TaxID=1884359 RepID=UPI000883D034|nr:hypothetical protein [Psychrobacillus sp. OK028]SDO25395.1 hypothetical protein SAMN05518871_11348 [Psychrobacillus sp. OK028]
MKKISVIFLLLLLSLTTVFYVNWESSTKAKFAETNENTVLATLSARVTTTFEEHGKPISNSRIIVINSLGEIIGTELTNSDGEAKIPVSVHKDPRFLMKDMGEVTVIAVANGYNEHINFSVPINEFSDNTGSVSIPLWKIDPNRRNEPQFIHGSFHRLTVFEMLDYYAKKIGLKRQNIKEDSILPAPWGPELSPQ